MGRGLLRPFSEHIRLFHLQGPGKFNLGVNPSDVRCCGRGGGWISGGKQNHAVMSIIGWFAQDDSRSLIF